MTTKETYSPPDKQKNWEKLDNRVSALIEEIFCREGFHPYFVHMSYSPLPTNPFQQRPDGEHGDTPHLASMFGSGLVECPKLRVASAPVFLHWSVLILLFFVGFTCFQFAYYFEGLVSLLCCLCFSQLDQMACVSCCRFFLPCLCCFRFFCTRWHTHTQTRWG